MITRKQYTKEFKLDAISLVLEQGYKQAEATRSLGLNVNMLGRWIKEHQNESIGTPTLLICFGPPKEWMSSFQLKSISSPESGSE